MIPFRKETPNRRDIKTVVTKYTDHRNDLKTDFKCRCGYCNDIDTWRTAWFEIDHFVPQKYLKNIKDTDYSNLVYSCRSCNNSKRAHWPTGNELIHNQYDEGFIDPCNDEYGHQFVRGLDGKISHSTPLGKWMYYKLKLHKPQHEVIWNIEETYYLINECKEILNEIDSPKIKDRLLTLYEKYIEYTLKLSEN